MLSVVKYHYAQCLLSVIMLSALLMRVIVLSVVKYHYAECPFDECYYTQCPFDECHYPECCYAESEGHYA